MSLSVLIEFVVFEMPEHLLKIVSEVHVVLGCDFSLASENSGDHLSHDSVEFFLLLSEIIMFLAEVSLFSVSSKIF